MYLGNKKIDFIINGKYREVYYGGKNQPIEKENNKSILYVDLKRWGIHDGFLNERTYINDESGNPIPKYTKEEWKIAYDNKYGLINALNYAKENGYGTVVLPRCNIFICYEEKDSNVNVYYAYKKYPIKIPSGIKLDMNNSTIKVIFDSKCLNPYDLSNHSGTNYIYRLPGCVFSFAQSYNSSIENGTLIGDIYERAFDDRASGWDRERACEFTTGINIREGASFSTIKNMTIKGFMGDAIDSMTDHDPNKGKSVYNPQFKFVGIIDSEKGLDVTQTDCYSTDFLPLTDWNTRECIMRTNIGYSRVPKFANPNFYIAFYDSNKTMLIKTTERYLQLIKVPKNAAFLRVSLIHEPRNLELNFVRDFQITPPAGNYLTIENCILTENHRGGISNIVNNTVIEKCMIYNNGNGVYEGFPLFPDSTRYAINCEDCLPYNLTVRDCYFFEHFNGILFAGMNLNVDNCTFKNMASCVVGYSFENITVSNCKAYNCGRTIGSMGSQYSNRTIIFTNNIMHNSGGGVSDDIICHMHHNQFIGHEGIMSNNNTLSTYSYNSFKFKRNDIVFRGFPGEFKKGENINIYVDDFLISTATFGLKILKDVSKINIYIRNDLERLCNVRLIDEINNATIENAVETSGNFITVDNENYLNHKINNCKLINCSFMLGLYSSVINNYTLKVTDTDFIISDIKRREAVFPFMHYNNEYLKRYDYNFENCNFTFNEGNYANILLSPKWGKSTGKFIFKNCNFKNTKSTQLKILNLTPIVEGKLELIFENCTFEGDILKSTSDLVTVIIR